MTEHDTSIDGSLLRLQRETRGWTMTDMAMRSCLSIKQIRQLEEGGSESFYSEAVKLTAAKKVASLLGLSTEQVLSQSARPLSSNSDVPLNRMDEAQSEAQAHARVLPAAHEPLHAERELADSEQNAAQPAASLDSHPKSTQTSVWVMAALFAIALLVAAWMNPSAEPAATDAEPPLQTLPTDASEPASSVADAASDAVVSSSAAVVSQARVSGVQAASSAASSPVLRASEAVEAASR
jgi:transcriptional regulator with XRE-family HTH domain